MRHSILLLALMVVACTLPRVNAQVADAGPDTLICSGSLNMQGSAVPPGGSGLWTLIAGCGTIGDPASPSTLFWPCPGLNTLVWEVNDGVSTTSDTVDVGAVDLPTIPDAGPDQTIVGPPFSAQLIGNQPTFPSYCYWTIMVGGSILTNPNEPITMVHDLAVGMNVFRYTCVTGPCVYSDEMGINAFVWTGIGWAAAASPPVFILDQQAECLSLNGPGRVEGLLLSDVQGRPVDPDPAGSGNSWSTAHYAPGIYVVRALVNGTARTQRFVVSR